MKSLTCIALTILSFTIAVHAAEAEKPIPLSSRITNVTLYADRAQVVRQAAVQLKAGTTVCAFQKLPGWTDEGSVRIALTPANSGRIADVRVKRTHLSQSRDKEVLKAREAVEKLADEIAALDDELKILDAEQKQVQSIRAFSLEKLPKDAALKDIKIDRYGDVVDFVGKRLRTIAGRKRDVQIRRRKLQPELAARQRRLNEVQGLARLEETAVLVAIETRTAQKVNLALTYMLPGATWQPAHELRAQGRNPSKVELVSYAVVSQTTGEDWKGAKLSFSTQSPTATIQIPELDALMLGNARNVSRLIGGQTETFQRAQQAFQGQNWDWFNYNNPKVSQQAYAGNNAFIMDTQQQSGELFRKLQKRGTTAHFAGITRPVVRMDGSSVRVPIGKVTLASKSRIVAAPQASLNAARTVEMINRNTQPLLPGKVSLFHDGAFLGQTDVDFVAQGESFAVFLGIADHIKLSRVLDRKQSSIVRGRKNRIQVAFITVAENLGTEPTTLSLADRIPVSERKDIRVDKVRIRPEVAPDNKGLLKWEVKLKPREKRVFTISYRVEYPPAVVQQMFKAKQVMPSSSVDLSEQIMELEGSF